MGDIKKVLFIDDDPALLKILQSRFPEGKIEFLVAIEPEEGIQKVREELPDLIILDLLLPKRSGLLILEEIRKDPKTKQTPVLILTIVSEKEVIRKAKQLGIVDYVVKGTISLDEFQNKIHTILWPHA